MKIEIELTGFTPVLDNLIQEYSLVTAAIYGIVWRYTQMSDKICKAPLEKIGKRLDLSGKTAERHIKTLCNDGYLVDLTPNLRNKPHIYAITGKAELSGTIAARSDRESYQGQTESPLKIHTKKGNKDILQNSQKDALNTLAPHIANATNGTLTTTDELKFAVLFGYDVAQFAKQDISAIDDTSQLKAIAGQAMKLYAKPNIAAKWSAYKKWWGNEHWLGKQGQPPTIKQIGATWGQFEADKVGPPANGSGPTLTEAQKQRMAELEAGNGS